MAFPLPPLQSLTPELKLNLRKSLESVLTKIIQTNNWTIFFREAALLSAFRERLTLPKAVGNVDTGPCEAIHTQDLVQRFCETIPLSLYEAYQPFISRFFGKSPCPSTAVRDLLSPGFPDFIAQTSGTSGSAFKSFPRYPVAENVDPTFDGVRFCAFSTFRFCGPAVEIVDEQGELQKEVFLTNVGSGIMRRRMGIAVKDDNKAMTETRKFFFHSSVATIGSRLLKRCPLHSPPLLRPFCSLVHPKFPGKPLYDYALRCHGSVSCLHACRLYIGLLRRCVDSRGTLGNRCR
jgi:hypothetical protein